MSTDRPILLTAFNPFGGRGDNPSQAIVEALAAEGHAWLVTEVLRTEFAYAGSRVAELINLHRPRGVLMLGLSERASGIRLERRAVNLAHARIADNAGWQPVHAAIRAGGPATYPSTLPLEYMGMALTRLGVPWQYSDDAGQFVCNHTFYSAADELVRLNELVPCGFVHVPDVSVMPVERMVEGVRACLELLREG